MTLVLIFFVKLGSEAGGHLRLLQLFAEQKKPPVRVACDELDMRRL
jgi:hypothetical protein